LNDRFLLPKNGFPARALFPGWYAMDSVKWLQRIVLLGPDEPAESFQSSGMNKVYNRVVETAPSQRTVTRMTEILVKSAIAWPPDDSKLPVGRHVVRGFAWTGPSLIRTVEFSSDGGRTWSPAKLEAAPKQHAWVRWTYSWSAGAGEHVLMSRAIDDAGNTQSLRREPGRKDLYGLNYCAPVRCSVQ
jgi:DMSO/TMAO reductase YedYZ molybdopterin-dependent catalytic subunit